MNTDFSLSHLSVRYNSFAEGRGLIHHAPKPAADGSKRLGHVDIAIPTFGYKNHIATDRRFGFIRGFTVTGGSAYDGAYLKEVLTKDNTASDVWADSAYRSKKNEAFLDKNGFTSRIHQKKPKGKPMSE